MSKALRRMDRARIEKGISGRGNSMNKNTKVKTNKPTNKQNPRKCLSTEVVSFSEGEGK